MRLVRTRPVPPEKVLPEVRMRLSPPHKIQGKDLCSFLVDARERGCLVTDGEHGAVDAAEDRARTRAEVRLAPADSAVVEGRMGKLI